MQVSDKYQVMPPLTREEYQALKEDIAENGVLVPVVHDEEGTIIDGHYRVQACQELEAEGRAAGGFPTQERTGLTEDEKLDLAWRLNMQRRHLNQEQKQDAIIAKLKESPEWADNRIAQLLGVDHKTVRVQRVILEGSKGIPKVEKVIGTDGKEYPRELEKKVKDKLQDAGFNRRFAAGLAQGLVQGAVTRERVEGPPQWASDPGAVHSLPEDLSEEMPFDHWSDEERALLDAFRAGESIVVNVHKNGPHENLVPWLRATDQLTEADRKTEWGNPFVEGEDGDGDRETVVRNFEQHYLPFKPSLRRKLSQMEGPTAWGCWCAPELCHCDVLIAWKEGRSLFS
jgi:ParB-like chromosome segregation protein Spo0J